MSIVSGATRVWWLGFFVHGAHELGLLAGGFVGVNGMLAAGAVYGGDGGFDGFCGGRATLGGDAHGVVADGADGAALSPVAGVLAHGYSVGLFAGQGNLLMMVELAG